MTFHALVKASIALDVKQVVTCGKNFDQAMPLFKLKNSLLKSFMKCEIA